MFAKSRHKSRYTHPGTVHPEFKAPACVRRSGLLSLMMIPALVPGNTRPEWAKSFTVGLWTQNTRDWPGMMSRQEPSWGITDFICILRCGRLSIRSYFCKLFTFTLHHEWFILNEHRRNPAIFACVRIFYTLTKNNISNVNVWKKQTENQRNSNNITFQLIHVYHFVILILFLWIKCFNVQMYRILLKSTKPESDQRRPGENK